MNTLLTIIGLIGITYIICYSHITNYYKLYLPKFFQDLLKCTLCTGFWVGIIYALLFPTGIFFLVYGGLISIASCAFDKYITTQNEI